MPKYTLDFPIIAWGSTEVEFDGTAEELEEAILNGEFQPNIGGDCIQNWAPLMDTDNIDFAMVEAPNRLEITE